MRSLESLQSAQWGVTALWRPRSRVSTLCTSAMTSRSQHFAWPGVSSIHTLNLGESGTFQRASFPSHPAKACHLGYLTEWDWTGALPTSGKVPTMQSCTALAECFWGWLRSARTSEGDEGQGLVPGRRRFLMNGHEFTTQSKLLEFERITEIHVASGTPSYQRASLAPAYERISDVQGDGDVAVSARNRNEREKARKEMKLAHELFFS